VVGGGAQVGEALSAAIPALEASGVETPRLDAEVMLSGITGIDRARMISEPDIEMEPAHAREFATAIRRRCAREPVAYILGRKGFRYIDPKSTQRVLVLRLCNEMLVEVALNRSGKRAEIGTFRGDALAIADEILRRHA
jgi:release factor glutamine methyltransferase